jgi:DNA-directed RNA polymerase specialized sigma24 family protein
MARTPRHREYDERKRALRPPAEPQELLPWPRLADDGVTPLGVDLSVHYLDVRRIMVRHFTAPRGWDMGDYVQQVCLQIARKNRTRSAHNPSKSSLGHYVWMVASNIGASAAVKEKRQRCLSLDVRAPDGTGLADDLIAPEDQQAWRHGAHRRILALRESGRLSLQATGYAIEVLEGVEASAHGVSGPTRQAYRAQIAGALGAVGP